jgi:hypothetical protein
VNRKGSSLDIFWLFILTVATIITWAKIVNGAESRILRLDDKKIGKIFVSYGKSTILSFPSKPSKVILGNKGAFSLEYIDSDLAVAALHPTMISNLFVYVQGRRFAFDLISRNQNPDEVVIVRDSLSDFTKPKVKKE